MCFFKKRDEEIPYSDVYTVLIFKAENNFDPNKGIINQYVTLEGKSHFIYLGEDMTYYDLLTGKEIHPYYGPLHSKSFDNSYELEVGETAVGYLRKQSIKSLKMSSKMEKDIMVSKKALIKLNKIYNKYENSKGRYTIILDNNEEDVKKQFLLQGLDFTEIKNSQKEEEKFQREHGYEQI